MTLLLTCSDVRALLSLDECIQVVEQAFRLHAEGAGAGPASLAVLAGEGGFHVKAAALWPAGDPVFAAKINGNFPNNPERGLPTIQGLVVLCHAGNGTPLAVMDSAEITALRTGAATAVAAKRLAPPAARWLTVFGCGVQGAVQARALARVLPIEHVRLFDLQRARAVELAHALRGELGIDVCPAASLAETASSDVVVTCTTAREPFLGAEHVRPGAFVAAVGADSPHKRELELSLLAASAVVVDSLEQCESYGELHHAIASGRLRRQDVRASLGDVVAGGHPGRLSPEEVVVFDSTGTALQDVAAAALVYRKALAAGVGVSLSLLPSS